MQPYKYRLQELMIAQFGAGRAEARRLFSAESGIPETTIHRDSNIRKGQLKKIAPARLEAYANWLQVPVTELRTQRLQPIAA